MPVPVNGPGGITLEWTDGLVLKAARHGWAAILEEITRSPETMSRLFSITDQMGRSMPTPENPFEREVPVHENFWLVASGNPSGAGYHTADMDVALRSRFFIIKCDQPMADEEALVTDVLGSGGDVSKLMNFVTDLRSRGEVYPSTRDLMMVTGARMAGMSLADAVRGSIVEKFPKKREGVEMLMSAHFTDSNPTTMTT